jgi:hypothetical protein
MKRVSLSPAERFILGFAPDTRGRIAIIHAARKELNDPGSVKNLRLGFIDMAAFVYLVGLNRQPVFFLMGPVVALASYVFLVYKVLSWLVR